MAPRRGGGGGGSGGEVSGINYTGYCADGGCTDVFAFLGVVIGAAGLLILYAMYTLYVVSKGSWTTPDRKRNKSRLCVMMLCILAIIAGRAFTVASAARRLQTLDYSYDLWRLKPEAYALDAAARFLSWIPEIFVFLLVLFEMTRPMGEKTFNANLLEKVNLAIISLLAIFGLISSGVSISWMHKVQVWEYAFDPPNWLDLPTSAPSETNSDLILAFYEEHEKNRPNVVPSTATSVLYAVLAFLVSVEFLIVGKTSPWKQAIPKTRLKFFSRLLVALFLDHLIQVVVTAFLRFNPAGAGGPAFAAGYKNTPVYIPWTLVACAYAAINLILILELKYLQSLALDSWTSRYNNVANSNTNASVTVVPNAPQYHQFPPKDPSTVTTISSTTGNYYWPTVPPHNGPVVSPTYQPQGAFPTGGQYYQPQHPAPYH